PCALLLRPLAGGGRLRDRGRASFRRAHREGAGEDLLGRLFGDLRRPGRPSVGGRPQPALDAGGGRLGQALIRRRSSSGRSGDHGQSKLEIASPPRSSSSTTAFGRSTGRFVKKSTQPPAVSSSSSTPFAKRPRTRATSAPAGSTRPPPQKPWRPQLPPRLTRGAVDGSSPLPDAPVMRRAIHVRPIWSARTRIAICV